MNGSNLERALAESGLTMQELARIIAADDARLLGNYPALAKILTDRMIDDLCKNGASFALGAKPGEHSDSMRLVTKLD